MRPSRRVAIIAYDGVDELDLAGVLAPLRKAGETAPAKAGLITEVIGPDTFRGSSGLLMTPHRTFCELCDFTTLDALVVPGGKGAKRAAQDPLLARFVLAARAASVSFYAVCSGALILRDLHLLEGLHVASHVQKRRLLAGSGCKLGSGVIRDRWLVSAGGFSPGDGLKGAEIAFCVLDDIAPELVTAVAHRMELWPRQSDRSVDTTQATRCDVQGGN